MRQQNLGVPTQGTLLVFISGVHKLFLCSECVKRRDLRLSSSKCCRAISRANETGSLVKSDITSKDTISGSPDSPDSPEEGHRSPKVLGKYYSYSTGVFAHGYLRASTSETHAQVSETARTGAAAGHSGESGRERRHAPLRGPHPLIQLCC